MKIFVVEDEKLSRQDIVVNLNRFGYTDIWEAENGQKALNLLNITMPDLIVSDIKMPLMDGLQLLKHVKNINPYIVFIILSGYDLFEYAKQAITYGAFGYLLKPFNSNELIGSIKKAEAYLTQVQQRNERNKALINKINDTLASAKNRLLCDIVNRTDVTFQQTASQYPELDLKLIYPYYFIVIINIGTDTAESITKGYCSIKSVLPDFIKQYENLNAHCFINNNSIVLLVNADHPESLLCSMSREFTSGFIRYVEKELPFYRFSFSIGKTVEDKNKICKSYSTAIKAFSQQPEPQISNLYLFKQEAAGVSPDLLIDLKFEKHLFSAFEQCNFCLCLDSVLLLYSNFLDFSKLDIEMFKKQNLRIILLIYKILSQLSMDPQELLGDEFELYNQLNSCRSLAGVETWYKNILQPCFEVLENKLAKDDAKIVDAAKKYISDHLSDNLTLENVACHVNLSTTYFSKFFKQELGTNFIDYVTDLRMDTAKELLKDSFLKVREIAGKVGFNDIRYFYKVFKKNTGFTPTEYKKLF